VNPIAKANMLLTRKMLRERGIGFIADYYRSGTVSIKAIGPFMGTDAQWENYDDAVVIASNLADRVTIASGIYKGSKRFHFHHAR
jgi:hypothetical protein